MKDCRKDITTIEVQFLAKVGKPNIRLRICEAITREEALAIAALIDGPEILTVRCWTTHNHYINFHSTLLDCA